MLLCEQIELSQLNFEGDCINVIRAAYGAGARSKEVEPNIFDIKYLLRHHPD